MNRSFRRRSPIRTYRSLSVESLEDRLPLAGPSPIDYVPTQVEPGEGGVIYLLSEENEQIYRWSTRTNRYLAPITTDEQPQRKRPTEPL